MVCRNKTNHMFYVVLPFLTMQAELEKLIHEMDQLDEVRQTDSSQDLAHFINHTRRLNQLNRKARIRLDQASASSS